VSVLEEIKARIDIVDLVSETVQLRHSGKNYTGFCPFHSNTRTPAFAVFPESGTWRCFGQCNEGGDIFGFVMKKEGWDFSETLRFLADKAGIELKPVTPQEQVKAEEHENLRALLEEAVTFYRHQFLTTPPGRAALDYLHQRGLTKETIEAFGLGYAPNSWDATVNYFKSKKYSEKDLIEAGLASERDSGGIFDRFRHRVMFPIRDERGRMAGFGARILDPNDNPKFLNSPQTPLFDKGHLLYGLDRARKAIRTQDKAVVVEGYFDVIALHQAGFANAVSPMGTALSEHHMYLLKRFTRGIVLALDSDAAGVQATLRGLQIARRTLDREQDPVFDPRGLLGYEGRLQADIRVTTLPEGMDPDEVVNRDPQEWIRIVESAKPVVTHVMETLATSRNLDDPKVKEEIASQVLPLIADVPGEIERETYRQRLARLLRVDERVLQGGGRGRPSRGRRAHPRSTEAMRTDHMITPAMTNYTLEAHLLGILMRQPDWLYKVDRELQEKGLARLTSNDFQHTDHQAILRLLQESLDQDMAEPLDYVLNRLSLSMMDIADTLLDLTKDIELSEERVSREVVRSILVLRKRNTHQSIEYHRFLMEDARESGDQIATQFQQTMVQLTTTLRKLDQAIGQYTSHAL